MLISNTVIMAVFLLQTHSKTLTEYIYIYIYIYIIVHRKKSEHMKRKIIMILLCGVLLVGITGCGSKNSENSGETKNAQKNSLATKVKIGDYVAYNTGEKNTYTSKADKTGYSKDQVFETTGEEKWRVLNILDDGTIELILEGSVGTKYDKGLYLSGLDGYNNAIEELNNISKIYGNGEHAISGRCPKEEDINKLIDLDTIVTHYQNEFESDIDTSGTREETFENIYKLVNKFYGMEKTFGSEKLIINSKFVWSSGMNSFGFESVVTDPVKLSMLKSGEHEIWLANQQIAYSENPMMGWSGYDKQISYFYMNQFSSYKGADMISVTASLDGTNISRTYEAENDGYLKPIVTLESGTKYSDGDGTLENPWTLK